MWARKFYNSWYTKWAYVMFVGNKNKRRIHYWQRDLWECTSDETFNRCEYSSLWGFYFSFYLRIFHRPPPPQIFWHHRYKCLNIFFGLPYFHNWLKWQIYSHPQQNDYHHKYPCLILIVMQNCHFEKKKRK